MHLCEDTRNGNALVAVKYINRVRGHHMGILGSGLSHPDLDAHMLPARGPSACSWLLLPSSVHGGAQWQASDHTGHVPSVMSSQAGTSPELRLRRPSSMHDDRRGTI